METVVQAMLKEGKDLITPVGNWGELYENEEFGGVVLESRRRWRGSFAGREAASGRGL